MPRERKRGRRWSVSPLELFVPTEIVQLVERAELHAIEKRMLLFTYANALRGRGRIAKVFREETAALNRVSRLLAVVRRGPLDQRQRPLPFMVGMPERLTTDWRAWLGPRAREFRRRVKAVRRAARRKAHGRAWLDVHLALDT